MATRLSDEGASEIVVELAAPAEDTAERRALFDVLPRKTFRLEHQVAAVERSCIVQALVATNGHRKAAAELLGVSLRTLFYKMRKHRIGARGERGTVFSPGADEARSGEPPAVPE